MPTNRELFFEAIKIDNPYINQNVIRSLLIKANSFDNDLELTLNFDKEISNLNLYKNYFQRVLKGEPYQYVINKSTFLGDSFYVDSNVLIPRQETEQLVLDSIDFCRILFNDKKITMADLCSGSGIIGIEYKKAFPSSKVYSIDLDKNALDISIRNSIKNNVNIDPILGDFIKPLIENNIKLDVLISNPPYIENINQIDKQVWDYEPHLALLASPCTHFYEIVFKNYDKFMNKNFFMSFEIDEGMEEQLSLLIKRYMHNATYVFRKDLYNKTRFLYIINGMDNDIKLASQKLLEGGVVGFATETVMGLGVVFDDFSAYNKLNKVKQRPEDKPYSLMIGEVSDIEKYAFVDKRSKKLIKAFLPGPVTFLLPVKDSVPSWVTHSGSVIGIRVPSHDISHKLLLEVKKPLLVPSANKSGEKPAMSSHEVKDIFKDEIDYVVNGDAEGGLPSTIIDLTSSNIKIVRQGPVTMDMILKVLEE